MFAITQANQLLANEFEERPSNPIDSYRYQSHVSSLLYTKKINDETYQIDHRFELNCIFLLFSNFSMPI